ncbi:MAG: 4-hydroxy-tetrahydrodipicolinate reductase [Flavobacterium sp. MedPE-SWcel]|uniref:4-hydroxy-tetrahydrodipicolinate reductase n=1 Tax=uncultured Flavobacterium sp. TaxID=165435 RepID=UPI00091437DC|nr:4-hydroxy-tetrahydrodipicolinate reductase [uncultured Flavobacterium sp.]OIQ21032.1 MAG: 4-hydroxy-tetrahydrodipicolinate reductase [Flavobacterium sp. MedPE-SWcel]
MKIALLGYGKMGKVIERIAEERGHEIVLRKRAIDTFTGLENADIAIEFSVPDAAIKNITECFNSNTPVISGTTGWLEHYDSITQLCENKNGGFIYASNFSLGVNVFFELNTQLAKMMSKLKQYNVSMEETHHTQKLDAPSGTAITLAEDIITHSNYSNWTIDTPKKDDIFIDAKREENVPGTHNVMYDSYIDSIEIKHTAHSREGFALGAVVAAEWLFGKKGVFSMKDVLDLK